MPPQGTYHYRSGSRKLPISLRQHFLKVYSAPAETEGGRELWSSKNNQNQSCKNIGHTILAPLTFLVSVLLRHNLDSSMLKCEGSLT